MRGAELVRSYGNAPKSPYHVAWSADGDFLAAAGRGSVAVWPEGGGEPMLMPGVGKYGNVLGLAWHPGRPMLAAALDDGRVRLWEPGAHRSQDFCTVLQQDGAKGVAWSPDGLRLAVTSGNGVLSVWDFAARALIDEAHVHESTANRPCWSPTGDLLVTCGIDAIINVLSSDDLRLIHRLTTDGRRTWDIDLSADGRYIASGSEDGIVRVWDLTSGTVTAALEGANGVGSVRFSADAEFLVSMSRTNVSVWRCRDWEPVSALELGTDKEPNDGIGGLAIHPSRPILAAKNRPASSINAYQMDYALLGGVGAQPDSRHYVNAKVVLLGDTGVGKSGLGLVLSGQPYQRTDSTHGRNVWTFDAQEVESADAGQQTREVLLWDLAGQPGYRLVHQLHLGEVAVALVVFDARSETDPFSGVKHWVRALAQARRLEGPSAVPLRAYLVAARADRGGVAVTHDRVQAMLDDLGLDGFFETSAKEGWRVADLAEAIREGIAWDALPMVSSSGLFDSIKQFLLEEKQQGRLLSTADDLFRSFRRAHPDITADDKLRPSFETCVGRVESRGLIRRLHFGDLVLLQPELLDAYASAMVQAAREEPDGLGFIPEEEALAGRFRLADSERVGDRGQEKLLLIATVEELLRHEIALKESTDRGVDLVFPSQFTRERPDAPDIPGKQVTFTFDGPLYSVYATLAVRLSHSSLFRREAMWQSAASYNAAGGGLCGIHLRELEEGRGELAVFCDAQVGDAVRIQFETYVAEHLQFRALAGTVTLRRVRSCGACGYVLPDDLVQRRLQLDLPTIRCPACEQSLISLLGEETPAPPSAAVAQMNRSANDRRDQNVAATRLMGKIETSDYDVFLCYSSKDRQHVVAIAERLKERGILPWLDIWEIRPGVRWQNELHRQLRSIRSSAVFLGSKGTGPWQEIEVQSLLQRLAKRNRPVIPVILANREGQPRLPPFLDLLHIVDLREPDPDPFEQLIWGITGQKADSL
jgi:hypothetical protein